MERKKLYLEIDFDNELANIGMNEAVLIGQLSLDLPHRSRQGLFYRSSGVKGPKFDLGITAMLEENRCQIETIDDLTFSVLLSQLESQRAAALSQNGYGKLNVSDGECWQRSFFFFSLLASFLVDLPLPFLADVSLQTL